VTRRVLFAALALVLLVACADAVEDVTAPFSPSASASPTSSPSEPTDDPSAEPGGGARPPIVVRTPVEGDEIVSPVTIAGTADVFEATVSIRILDESGTELASTFTTATCGSGCRGSYSADVSFFVERRQEGTIEVFESSAEDGSELNLVSITVVLVPGG
jgi:immunoglobulin-like protein involved in spore germination